jgi:uncharacterized Zn finger protein
MSVHTVPVPTSASQAVMTKGMRLADEGRASELHGRVFEVRGDTGRTYTVVIGGTSAGCDCPATGTCSHVVAAVVEAGEGS